MLPQLVQTKRDRLMRLAASTAPHVPASSDRGRGCRPAAPSSELDAPRCCSLRSALELRRFLKGSQSYLPPCQRPAIARFASNRWAPTWQHKIEETYRIYLINSLLNYNLARSGFRNPQSMRNFRGNNCCRKPTQSLALVFVGRPQLRPCETRGFPAGLL